MLPMIEDYQRSLVSKSHETQRRYLTSLNCFEESDVELDESCLERFYLYCRHKGLAEGTSITHVAGLSSYLRFLTRRDALVISMEKAEARYDEVKGRKGYKTPEIPADITSVLQAALQTSLKPLSLRERRALLRDRALLSMLITTGMRRSEICSLTRAQAQQEEVILTGKGRKERVIFIPDDTHDLVCDYLQHRTDSSDHCFVRHDRGGDGHGLAPGGVWLIVKRWAQEAGVDAHPHLFRHKFACDALGKGVGLSIVQELMGHASPATTKQIYGRHDRAQLRAAAASIWKDVA